MNNWRLLMSLLLWAVAGSSAWAQYNLRQVPLLPVSGAPWTVQFADTPCTAWVLPPVGAQPTVSLDANSLRVFVDQVRVPNCTGLPTAHTVSIPPMPDGLFTLELWARSGNASSLAQSLPFFVTRPPQFYHVRTEPTRPAAGEPFHIIFDSGPCEIFFPEPPGLAPSFTNDSGLLALAVDHMQVIDCSATPTVVSIPVAGLPAGTYPLMLVARALQSPENYGHLEGMVLTVGQAVSTAPALIPTNSAGWLALLAVLLVMWGTWRRWGPSS